MWSEPMTADAGRPARHPDHPLLAVGRRQVDAVATAARGRPRGALLDLGDDPAAAARRAGGARLLLPQPPRVRGDGRGRRDARARRGLRQPLRHAARAGRGGDRRRPGRALRRRLAGRPADPQLDACATPWCRSSSCRRRSPSSRAGSGRAGRTRTRWSRAGWRSPATRSATGPSTTTCWSTSGWRPARRSCRAIIGAERLRRERRPDLVEVVRRLNGEFEGRAG